MLLPHQVNESLEITKQVVDWIICHPGHSSARNIHQVKFIKARVIEALSAYITLLEKEREFAKKTVLRPR